MDTAYRGLGFDPTPGELGSVTQAITQLTGAADALAEVRPALRRAEELTGDWHGGAADAFRSRLRDAPAGLETRERSLRRAAGVLDRWADTLTANKHRTEELDQRALRLRGRLETAQDLLQDKQNARDLAATPVAAAAAATDLAAASNLVAELESALAEVLVKARTLERDHLRTAEAVAAELAEIRGGDDVPPRAPAGETLARMIGQVLDRTSRTSSALAGLLTPAGPRATPPAGAAGALAAALSGGGTIRR